LVDEGADLRSIQIVSGLKNDVPHLLSAALEEVTRV
jgi:hypothetical protein